MSEVRMCDKCGIIFSTLLDGWQTMTMQDQSKSRAYNTGLAVAYDVCPECAATPPQAKVPRVAGELTAGETTVHRSADTVITSENVLSKWDRDNGDTSLQDRFGNVWDYIVTSSNGDEGRFYKVDNPNEEMSFAQLRKYLGPLTRTVR